MVALIQPQPHEGGATIGARTLSIGNQDFHDKAQGVGPSESHEIGFCDGLIDRAEMAASFLKALGHDGRLMILCHLQTGPKSVTELENLLSSRQAVVSQQLARLRLEGLVSARREGQAIYYSLLDPKVAEVIALLARLFGEAEAKRS